MPSPYLTRFNVDGQILGQYDGLVNEDFGHFARGFFDDGDLVIGGLISDSNGTFEFPVIRSMTTDFQLNWEYVFEDVSKGMFSDLIRLNDQEFLAYGQSDDALFFVRMSTENGQLLDSIVIPISSELADYGLRREHGTLLRIVGDNAIAAYSTGTWETAGVGLLRIALGPVMGCTDVEACNFNPEAEEDDGSCLPYDALAGCMDDSACNFNANALCEDESCVYPLFPEDCAAGSIACAEGTVWDSMLQMCIPDYAAYPCGEGTVWDPNEEECVITVPSDTDFDGCVSMTDLLDLLTVFGTCPEVEPEHPCGEGAFIPGDDMACVGVGTTWHLRRRGILLVQLTSCLGCCTRLRCRIEWRPCSNFLSRRK